MKIATEPMKPLRGKSREAPAFGHGVRAPMAQWHTTDGPTSLVADRALYREDNRPTLSETRLQWLTRVPATWGEAQAVLTQAAPETMAPRRDGDRDRGLPSTDGGVAQRWGLISAEQRRPQAQRTVDKHLGKHRAQAVNAVNNLCRTACAADAPQALSPCAHGLQATLLAHSPVRSTPRDGQRGRPGPDPPPAQVIYAIEGARAAPVADRQALIDPHRCFLLATNERDDTQLPPHELREGYPGQGQAARGVRFLKDPRCLASSRSRKSPSGSWRS
jgi:hypothetical protein